MENFGIDSALKNLGVSTNNNGTSTGSKSSGKSGELKSFSPVNGQYIGSVSTTTREEYDQVVATAQKAFLDWREVTAPARGEIVRQFGEKLRKHKADLGKLVSFEMGKSYQEGPSGLDHRQPLKPTSLHRL